MKFACNVCGLVYGAVLPSPSRVLLHTTLGHRDLGEPITEVRV